MQKTLTTWRGKWALACAVLLLVSFCLLPFVQILSTSFKHQYDWGNPSLLPQQWNFDAYKELLGLSEQPTVDLPPALARIVNNPKLSASQRQAILSKYQNKDDVFPFGRFMLNSFLLSAGAAAISLFLAILGAYALSRLRFGGRVLIQRSVLFVYMIGGVLLMVPLYQMAVRAGLASTAVGALGCLLVIYVVQTLPVALYMLGNYFRGIPYALEEAAMMDGYSRWQAIFKIVLPLSAPMLATVFIYCFIIGWNEYLFASVFLKPFDDYFTLPLALQELFVSKNAIWDRIMAASALTLVPVLICFMVAMRHLQGDMTQGGVKE